MDEKIRSDVLLMARSAIDAVRGDRLVEQAAGDARFDHPVEVAAIGKAAAAMATGARRMLGEQIRRVLLITKTGHLHPDPCTWPDTEVMEAGHPLPDEGSLAAGERLLQWLAEAPAGHELLFLVSGGTSSLVEAPAEGIDLTTLRRVNDWLLGSSLDIDQINSVRRRLSRIKGGGLVSALGGHRARVWLISDVAGDDPAVIGSGLLYPPRTSREPPGDCPDWLQALLQAAPMPQQPDRPVPEHSIVGNLKRACEAAATAARELGYVVHLHPGELDGDAARTGRDLVAELQTLPSGIHIWGGETTVHLPARPGRGGRNQQLALAAAVSLDGCTDRCLLSIGTDGTDGPTDDAGALVDGGTIGRGTLDPLDAAEALRKADAGRFLEASGDLVTTGPTGTNVRDLVIAWKQ
jgi:hydroxypyruvate reductase